MYCLRLLDNLIGLDVLPLRPDDKLETRPFLEKGKHQKISRRVIIKHGR